MRFRLGMLHDQLTASVEVTCQGEYIISATLNEMVGFDAHHI